MVIWFYISKPKSGGILLPIKNDLYVFLIYDMKELITTAYFFSKKDINKIKFNKYTSRKEVILPIIERLYKNE